MEGAVPLVSNCDEHEVRVRATGSSLIPEEVCGCNVDLDMGNRGAGAVGHVLFVLEVLILVLQFDTNSGSFGEIWRSISLAGSGFQAHHQAV